jgi:abelson tyrosine-protein kinase 1
MEGAQILTPEMDVYAFGICCWEILNMGAMPWPRTDDIIVRHLVLSAYPLLYCPTFSRE